jgi:hypothetical protein
MRSGPIAARRWFLVGIVFLRVESGKSWAPLASLGQP